MTHFAEVVHHEWIAAPLDRVCAQFADLQHHIDARVHPKLRFEILQQGPRRARFAQEVRLLGIRQRDIFERDIAPDGTIHDVSVEGFNKGGALDFHFTPALREGHAGTEVAISIRLPLPPALGPLAPLVRPLLERQILREVRAAAAEDKLDLELRGYRPPARPS